MNMLSNSVIFQAQRIVLILPDLFFELYILLLPHNGDTFLMTAVSIVWLILVMSLQHNFFYEIARPCLCLDPGQFYTGPSRAEPYVGFLGTV